jgi:hypothetical protein
MTDAWPTPNDILNSLYWRLIESGRPTNALLSVGSAHLRDTVEAWVFPFVYAEQIINVAFTRNAGRAGEFFKAIEVENNDWKNYAPQLPALALNTRFRTAFEWFLVGESATPGKVDFTDDAVADGLDDGKLRFYSAYNPVAVKRDRVPRTIRTQNPR